MTLDTSTESRYTDEDFIISRMNAILKHYEAISRDVMMTPREETQEAYDDLGKALREVLKAEARLLLMK